MSSTRTALRLVGKNQTAQQADDAEFERQYKKWPDRRRIELPRAQLRMICQIFFRFGTQHGISWSNDQLEEANLRGHRRCSRWGYFGVGTAVGAGLEFSTSSLLYFAVLAFTTSVGCNLCFLLSGS
jgi:hypothetical protein